ncbi:transposase [Streptomyces sp. NPDC059168]|uniref:transposase n=1 Tax=Streptomyces sp. NPDC059168 TaxID=3346753 RepID=UPI0036856F6B
MEARTQAYYERRTQEGEMIVSEWIELRALCSAILVIEVSQVHADLVPDDLLWERVAPMLPPDRQAAEAVRCRIDDKYAMAMELEDPGFHHNVLADFRDRLTEHGRADRLLDLALARLKEAGLVRERTTQRTDSPTSWPRCVT